MKNKLLLFLLLLSLFTKAQSVTSLSPGKYEAKLKAAQKAWEKGDIILLDEGHEKLSASGDVGEYKFSVAAQRIFFTSGPLKSAFTKVSAINSRPVIIIPAEENSGLGITAEVWASKE